MINRYQGNSGRVERFPESGEERRAPPREQIPRRQLETDDIILLLILYLMYRESGDSELLIIMGAMFLL